MVIKETKVSNITVYMPKEAKRRLVAFSKSQGTTISWLIRNFVDSLVKDFKEEDAKKEE